MEKKRAANNGDDEMRRKTPVVDSLQCETDHSDPITALYLFSDDEEVLAFLGTAGGMVKMLFQQTKTEWRSVVLCRRSEEAIVGFHLNSKHELFALVGDNCVRTWDLINLQTDVPPIRGCRQHRRIEFPIIHSAGYCSTTSVLMHGSNVAILRSNGEGCMLNLDTLEESILRDVGPLPAMNSNTFPVALCDDNMVVYASMVMGKTTLSLWDVNKVQRFTPLTAIPQTSSGVGRCFMTSNNKLLLLLQKYDDDACELMTLNWQEETAKPCRVENVSRGIVAFDFQAPDLFACVTRHGDLMVAKLVDNKLETILHQRSIYPIPSFFFALPYFLSITAGKAVTVVFNDDFGLHVITF